MSDGNYNDRKRAEASLVLAKRQLSEAEQTMMLTPAGEAFYRMNIENLQERLDDLNARR